MVYLSNAKLLQALLYTSLKIHVAKAQPDTIYGSVAFVRNGERTPLVLHSLDSILQLTTYGAQQVYATGSFYRNRYVPNSVESNSNSTAIYGLSSFEMDPNQLWLLAADTQYNIASAQAFLQAFYPPYDFDIPNDDISSLPNATVVNAPLDGYQYPWVHTASTNDPQSIYVAATENCRNFILSMNGYSETDQFKSLSDDSASLYAAVGNALGDENLPSEAYSYGNSYPIYDYLSYMALHNSTFNQTFVNATNIPQNSLGQLKSLSDEYQWATHASTNHYNGSNSSQIGTIAGQTLLLITVEKLTDNIRTSGQYNKLNLLFGEYEAMLGLAFLAGLASEDASLMDMPEFASSLVFELYTNASVAVAGNYPNQDDLRVRLLFQNGTDAPLNQLATLGTQTSMPWEAFINLVGKVSDVAAWCQECDSWTDSFFCQNYNDTSESKSEDDFGSKMSPRTAGLVGAVSTLAAIGAILIVAVGFGGLRFKRVSPNKARQGNFGGFKGDQKLASDTDLAHANFTNKDLDSADYAAEGQAHERIGSWELQKPNLQRPTSVSIRRLSHGDENIESLRPVVPDERV